MEHDFDGFEPPEPLPIRRVCARRECRDDARPSGKLCRTHHAQAMRRLRARRRAAGPSTACPSSSPPSATPQATRARKRLERDRKRGKLQASPCAICNSRKAVVATHPDPARPEAIVWACRKCRHELVRGARERRESQLAEITRRREQEAAASQLLATLSEIDRLPADVAAALRETASQGGRLGRLPQTSPLYQQRLVAVYRRWLDRQPPPRCDSADVAIEPQQ